MMTLEINPPKHDSKGAQQKHVASRKLVLVASEPLEPGRHATEPTNRGGSRRSRHEKVGPNGLLCTRLAAHSVANSAAWCRRLSRRAGVSPSFMEPTGPIAERLANHPEHLSAILALMDQADETDENRVAIIRSIVALQAADAVIVGPLAADDANAPGLLPHLADLASNAYRALRPPRELIAHPAFGQIARKFQYIQMNEQEARALGAGATDLGILAQRLRRLQGDPGEFAITSFARRGILWADGGWWELEPIKNAEAKEPVVTAVFSMAWMVARRFRNAGAARALEYAHSAAAIVANPGRGNPT
jgi:hypothetical protein